MFYFFIDSCCFRQYQKGFSSRYLILRSKFCITSRHQTFISCNFYSSTFPVILHIIFYIREIVFAHIIFRKSCSLYLQSHTDNLSTGGGIIEPILTVYRLFDDDILICKKCRILDISGGVGVNTKSREKKEKRKEKEFFHILLTKNYSGISMSVISSSSATGIVFLICQVTKSSKRIPLALLDL